MTFTMILITCQLTFFWANFLFSQSLEQKLNESASVDWSRQVILASGNSSSLPVNSDASQRIAALERAKAAAIENLFKAVQELTLDSRSKVSDAVKDKSLTVSQLRQIVRKFTIIDTRSMSDMSVEVDVELPIIGNLLPLILPHNSGRGELRVSSDPLCPLCLQPWPEAKKVPQNVHLIVPAEGLTTNKGTPYTGLIIDVRGLEFKPALNPKVLNAANEEVYGTDYIDPKIAFDAGIVIYKDNLNKALRDERIGKEPLIIRGVQVSGPLNSDIIISNNDAVLIHAAAKKQNFLKECKVIILIG